VIIFLLAGCMQRLKTAKINRHEWSAFGRTPAPERVLFLNRIKSKLSDKGNEAELHNLLVTFSVGITQYTNADTYNTISSRLMMALQAAKEEKNKSILIIPKK
jgi:hypothetical protein